MLPAHSTMDGRSARQSRVRCTEGRRMDVSTPAQVRIPDHHEICCDACGYPRMGLPAEARCPECGAAPPKLVEARGKSRAMTLGRQAWLRCISAGLVLLIVTYALALQVILMMSIWGLSSTAVNVPAPKIAAAALLQRSLGGKPGMLGVAGTLAVLGSLLSVWLISSPRHLGATAPSGETLRLWLRWTAVLTTGGALGLMLARTGIYTYYGTSPAGLCLGACVAGCELPSATLLYLYLRHIAREIGDARARRGFTISIWLVPLSIAGTLGLVVIDAMNMEWGAVRISFYVASGAVCVTAGLIATAGIARLTITVIRAAFTDWLAFATRAVARFPLVVGRLASAAGRDSSRWSIVAGIIIWLATIPGLVNESLWQGTRFAAGGDHPYINLPGPKFTLGAVALARLDSEYPYRKNHLG